MLKTKDDADLWYWCLMPQKNYSCSGVVYFILFKTSKSGSTNEGQRLSHWLLQYMYIPTHIFNITGVVVYHYIITAHHMGACDLCFVLKPWPIRLPPLEKRAGNTRRMRKSWDSILHNHSWYGGLHLGKMNPNLASLLYAVAIALGWCGQIFTWTYFPISGG